jgi:HEAT repeat protein
LVQRTDQLWEEILRLHSGGYVNRLELARQFQTLWPHATDQEVVDEVFKDKTKLLTTPAKAVYPMLFQELVDIRARPAIPRIFELLKATGKFDPILEHATNALVGIGGPELVTDCKEALKSWNPRSREAAMRSLASLGDPETRSIAYECFNSSDLAMVRDGLSLLKGIGPKREDVPALIRGMQKFESLLFDPQITTRIVGYGSVSEDQLCESINNLASLGAQAEDALPTLEQMATNPRDPLSTTLQEPARKAVEKIKNDLSKNSP